MDARIDKRKRGRVEFSRGVDVRLVAIDGTWTMPCTMLDVGEKGAKLVVKSAVQRLNGEFFLMLSATGNAYRRCELAWMNGEQIGLRFIEKDRKAGYRRKAADCDG